MPSDIEFMVVQKITDGPKWEHVLENKTLYIYDKESSSTLCRIEGKDKLMQLCGALGLVGTGIKL